MAESTYEVAKRYADDAEVNERVRTRETSLYTSSASECGLNGRCRNVVTRPVQHETIDGNRILDPSSHNFTTCDFTFSDPMLIKGTANATES